MGDMGDDFRAWHADGKRRRNRNQESSPKILRDKGIEFQEMNNGVHLIVQGKDGLIDFWPSTGKFIARSGRSGRGVFNLIKLCEVKDG